MNAVQPFGGKERLPKLRDAQIILPQMLGDADVLGDSNRPFEPQTAIIGLDRHAVQLRIAELAHRRTQIAPAFFQGDQRGGEEPFGLRRIARIETEFFLALADGRQQVVRHALAQPINSRLRMLPGTSHRKGRAYHPCVPIGRLEPSQYHKPASFVDLFGRLAEREGEVSKSAPCRRIRDLRWQRRPG